MTPRKLVTQFLFTTLSCLLASMAALAQPANDDCTNATPITIGSGGFGLGIFTSTQYDLTAATLQSGETFAPSIIVAGLNKKSIWYKFTLPTTRAARISLAQPGSGIQAGNVGFAVYKANTCLPGNAQISTKFSPIEIFGSSFHPCVESGDYLVQVTSNLNANGPVFITVDLSDTTGAAYDKPANAYQFPGLATNKTTAIDFLVQCQSIDDAVENCLPNTSFKDFTKSTWHTFTTPNYFDWFTVLLTSMETNPVAPDYIVGYRIYQGNSRTTPVSSLTPLGGCDSMKMNGYYPDRKVYKCGDLLPNTSYTVQILYHKDFIKTMRMAVAWNGTAPTNGPEPIISLPTPNNMGTLLANTSGLNNTASDNLACNSRHSQHNCPNTMPVNGVLNTGSGLKHNLSAFFSFKLATSSSLTITVNTGGTGHQLVRLYKQGLTTNCADLDIVNLVGSSNNASSGFNWTLTCLQAGDYVLQTMGVDSISPKTSLHWSSLSTNPYPLNLLHNLGGSIDVSIVAKTEVDINKFALSAPGKFDKINANGAGIIQPLLPNVTYVAKSDTFGCTNTVIPDLLDCLDNLNQPLTKASYHEFLLADSAMVFVNLHNTWNTKLYKGDADALATAQNKHNYPDKFTGLEPISKCLLYYNTGANPYACAVPGTYTLAQFDNRISLAANLEITPKTTRTKHSTPATAQDMGDLWSYVSPRAWFQSDVDTFTCHDNPVTIDGVVPCNSQLGIASTKLIYRQFYLSKPSTLTIINYVGFSGEPYGYGVFTLFTGKATDGIASLRKISTKWTCFTQAATTGACDVMPVGWYTVVSYGSGPNYANPLGGMPSQNYQQSSLGRSDKFMIYIDAGCAGPKFSRPYKASVDMVTGQPYKIEWGTQTGHTTAYPVTSKKYTLNTENFDCSQDTAFIRQNMRSCATDNVKVAFYVFTTTQVSYVQIDGFENGLWASIYGFDVRTADSARMKTEDPLQTCLNKKGAIEFCKLMPGTYTLVLYVTVHYTCTAVTPTIYIDQVGQSRFDHAANAYDFGAVTPDSSWYKGKPGDVNPLNSGRAPSNDFFFCTTGAQVGDPAEASCLSIYNPFIYAPPNNVVLHPNNTTAPDQYHIDRRNLWYTFTINHAGTVRVRVKNMTPGKQGNPFGQGILEHQYPFAVYKSNVDGTLPFAQVASNGDIDSTLLQGLEFITRNHNGGPASDYCKGSEEFLFYVEPCSFIPTRYYIMVENRNPSGVGSGDVHSMNPNSQVEVSVLFDSVNANPPKFDHYSQANDLGLVNSGTKKGATDHFTCATRDLPEPNVPVNPPCQKTLWYKFTTTVTGTIRYTAFIKNIPRSDGYSIRLYKQIIPNDSSANGLLYVPLTSYSGSLAQQCISPGTYYIILPGCNAVNEDVYPEIEIIPSAGDFCSVPMVTGLTGPGTRVVPVTVDCHTIGTDYGEFNPTLTCPAGATTNQYKTSWYRLDITGTDTLDVTVFINEKTNATSTDIKYRMMTGSCGAMQEQSCVQDALTRNTYKCLSPGNSYYIQVFSPISYNGQPVTGDVDLNISAVVHADTCQPANTCIGVANFTPQFDCTKDKDVIFTNFSTFGSSIGYQWNFGYNGQTSNAVSPRFFYPALTTTQTYTVKLVLTNSLCGKKDSVIQTINIPARPAVNLGNDTVICTNGATLLLNATSHTGSTYAWYNGSTQPTLTVGGIINPWVEVTYNNCKARDTVKIYVNPITKRTLQTKALCAVTQVTLDAARGQGEQFQWNTGAASPSIAASQPGYYWADIYLNGCITRDSFLVVSTSLKPLGNDTSFCQAGIPYAANATVSGATSYTWQNNTTNPIFSITKAGVYWVDINLGGCTFRDSLTVGVDSFKTVTTTARICQGQNYVMPSGRSVTLAGIYKDSLKYSRGCDSIITTVTLGVDTIKRINNITSICAGQTYILPSGRVVTTPGIYNDTARNQRGCDSIIAIIEIKVGTPVIADSAAFICKGQSYLLPSGKVITNSGLYRDSLRSVFGCDSLIVNLTLTVDTARTVTGSASICAGKTFTLPSGRIVNTAGLHTDTLKNMRLCDSLISSISLSIIPAQLRNTNTFICTGQSYTLPSGRIVSASGNYQDTLRTSAGCDSIITSLLLTVYSALQNNKTAFICSGQLYSLPSGRQVSATGIYNDTIRYTNGCDSLRTNVNLTVYNKITNNISISRCAGQSYTLPSGRLVTATGIYLDTIRYTNGCDSLFTTVNLVIGSALISAVTTSICAGQSFTLPGGRLITAAGMYEDTVRTTSGCDSLITRLTLSVDLAAAASISASICNGKTYSLPSGRLVTLAGNYLDTIKNVRGCDSVRYTVSVSILPVIKVDRTATICTGQSYTLPGGNSVSAAGLYRDTLFTSAGCDSIINTTLTVHPPISVVISGNTLVCQGSATTLTATAANGNGGPYGFNWSPAGSTASITVAPLVTTKYLVTITDGCTVAPAIDSVTVTVVPKPDSSFTISASVICAPASVNFNAVATGVRYKWNFGTGNAGDTAVTRNPTFTYNSSGTYNVTLTVTTPGGCTSSSFQTIVAATSPQASFAQPLPICAGGSSSFTGAASNPAGITWNWSFGNGNTATVQNPPAQTYAVAGNYVIRLIVSNTAGCADTINRTLVVAPVPVPGLNNATEKICLGASVVLRAQGGVNYDWSPSLWLSDAARASPTATPPTTTQYRVIVTNAAGCKATDSVLVQVMQPFVMVAPRDTFVCAGGSVQLLASGASRYVWTGTGLNSTTVANPTAKPNDTATYTVTGYGADNCFTQTATFTINHIPLPFVDAGPDTTVLVGSNFALLPQFGTGISTYLWTPGTYLSCATCPNPIVTPRTPITYTVTVGNAFNCEASDSRIIKLLCTNESIFIPNTFTPNGDGANDVFYPRGEGIKSVRFLRVYNRWGQLLFERLNFSTNDRSQGWDGTFKGEKLAPDVYVYSLGMVCDNGQVIDTKGNVMIVR
ncbi:MAG: PKD domain-containing protein [Bacteroidota bacterium]